jgi:hypothetical protein
MNNYKYQQYASFKLSWSRQNPVIKMIMIKMLMLLVLLLLTQVVKTTPVNIMDQNNYPLEMITYTYNGGLLQRKMT